MSLLYHTLSNAEKANLAHVYNSLELAAWECYSPGKTRLLHLGWRKHILLTFTSPPPRNLLVYKEDSMLRRPGVTEQEEFSSNSFIVVDNETNGDDGKGPLYRRVLLRATILT